MGFSDDVDENLGRATRLIHSAAAAGARIVCLPELATNVYFCFEENPVHKALAEPVPGPSTERMCGVAAECAIYLVFPMYEREGDHLYNTAVFIGPDGTIRGKYRKNSIPDVRLPDMVGIEKYYFDPGNLGYPVFDTEFGIKVAVTICYERHFPESTRSLALAGADVIFVPTATAAGHSLWDVELRGHAIANLCWVGGVNRVGRDRGGSDAAFWGDSLFSSPSGEVVARAQIEGDEVVRATIDTEVSQRLRADWGFFRDRRPELYGGLVA
jgi:N-carbamoylputrescine amidase